MALVALADVAGNLAIAGNGPELMTIVPFAHAFEKASPRASLDVVWNGNSKHADDGQSRSGHIAVTGTEAPDLSATPIAWDGIGVLVHLSNFTKEVTKQQVADMFSGKITGAAKVIGLDEQVVKTVVGTVPPLSAITSLSQGLSVVSGGVPVRLLPIDKVEPEVLTVKDGRYPFRRPVLFLSKKEPHPVAEAFTQFVLSQTGQQLIAETYIPIKET
jgi:phosphate transport system substrate-binding protein